MSSLLTNASAMTALQTLATINKNLATTQERISTGMRVNQASDNAAYWSIATGMRAHNASLSAVQDTIGLGKAIVDTAYTALNEAIDLTKQIMAKHVAKEQMEADSAEAEAIQAEIDALVAQVDEIAKQATFQGKNLLSADAVDITVVSGYNIGAADANASISKVTVKAYVLEGTLSGVDSAHAVEAKLNEMIAAAGDLGAAKIQLDSQARFTSALMDSIDRGIGQLVDADMNEESARLSALQVQQQLGIQALSIANANAQNILALFR